jgi:hypothetical protein
MKKILLIFLLSLFLFSCKKTEYHYLTFEITFLDKPAKGSSNFITIGVTPNNRDQPNLDRFNLPEKWTYNYASLVKGDEVKFHVYGQLSYYYEMRVFIDNKEVSYLKVRTSDHAYYSYIVEDRYGLNMNQTSNSPYIQFVFN